MKMEWDLLLPWLSSGQTFLILVYNQDLLKIFLHHLSKATWLHVFLSPLSSNTFTERQSIFIQFWDRNTIIIHFTIRKPGLKDRCILRKLLVYLVSCSRSSLYPVTCSTCLRFPSTTCTTRSAARTTRCAATWATSPRGSGPSVSTHHITTYSLRNLS